MSIVQLTPFIRYIPLSDGEGDWGLMVHHLNDTILDIKEVHDKQQFTDTFNRFVAYSTVAA